MALSQSVIASQRQANMFWLRASEATVLAADYDSYTTLPTGFGDCKLYEVHLIAVDLTTMLALTDTVGALVQIQDAGGNVVDIVGSSYWQRSSVNDATCTVKPAVVRLWRESDRLRVQIPDLDTGAAAASLYVFALVQRTRDQALP